MTLDEFNALRHLENRRVHMVFSDGQQVIATLVSATTDFDGSRHLIYDKVEWSALPHIDRGNSAYYVPGEVLVSCSIAALNADENASHPIAIDSSAKSASSSLPAFIARPSDAPVYHGFQILDDVVVDGFTLGIITSFEEGGVAEGDAFIIAPDNSRAGLVWSVPDGSDDNSKLDQVCPMEKSRWGVWELFFPFRMADCDDARRNLQAVLPMLKPKWEEWRRTFGAG